MLAILTLGLGIGATTAVFSVVNSVLIQPLPYPDAGRVVGVWHRATFQGATTDSMNLSPPMYIVGAIVLLIAAGLASYIPARKALSSDLLGSLKAD